MYWNSYHWDMSSIFYILIYYYMYRILPTGAPSNCRQQCPHFAYRNFSEAIHAKQLFSQQEHILARITPFFIITNLVRFCYYFIHFRAYNFIYSVLANHYYKEVCHLLHIVKLKVVIIEQMG